MKIVTMLNDGQEQVGILSEDGKSVIPANKYADMPTLFPYTTLFRSDRKSVV